MSPGHPDVGQFTMGGFNPGAYSSGAGNPVVFRVICFLESEGIHQRDVTFTSCRSFRDTGPSRGHH